MWYYDSLPRGDADRMVKNDGDYLVRFSDTKGYVLTTKWEGQAKHFVIQKLEDEVWCTCCLYNMVLRAHVCACVVMNVVY